MSANQEQPKTTIRCSVTGKERETGCLESGEPKLPPGWKRFGDAVFSPEGFRERCALRTVRLPVASVLVGYHTDGNGAWTVQARTESWKSFRAALKLSQQQGAQLACWLYREFAKLDNEPLGTSEKGRTLPKWTLSNDYRKVLYALGRQQWPDLDSQSFGSLLKKCEALYKEQRFEMRVLVRRSLPAAEKLPVPIPQASVQDFRLSDQKQLFVSLRLSGERFTLRLRNGWQFERAIAALGQALADPAEADLGEINLYERRADCRHRTGGEARSETKAPSRSTEVMLSAVVWLKKRPQQREAVIIVRTQADRLWDVLTTERDAPWLFHADGLKQFLAGHARRRQSISDDRKFERRAQGGRGWLPEEDRGRPGSKRRKRRSARLNDCGERLSRIYRKRLDDFVHKAARWLANWAVRQRAAVVRYDDSNRDFFGTSFPWFKLRTLLTQKLNEFDVSFEHTGGSDSDGSSESAEVLE